MYQNRRGKSARCDRLLAWCQVLQTAIASVAVSGKMRAIFRRSARRGSGPAAPLTRSNIMKADIHPKYEAVTATCSCGNKVMTRPTLCADLHIDVCSECHPFFTGKQKVMDTGGRDRFNKRFGNRGTSASQLARRAIADLQWKKRQAEWPGVFMGIPRLKLASNPDNRADVGRMGRVSAVAARLYRPMNRSLAPRWRTRLVTDRSFYILCDLFPQVKQCLGFQTGGAGLSRSGPFRKDQRELTKPAETQLDPAPAYSPWSGRALPRNRQRSGKRLPVYRQGNLVAVISNGTAVLGLGNLGALASKPVMEARRCYSSASPASTRLI